MPEATPAPAAGGAPAPAATPAAPNPAAPLKVSLMESILASNRAKAIMDPTKPPEAPKVEAKPAAEPPKPAEPKPVDPALKRITKLEKENLDYKAKIAELETTAADAKALADARKLFAEGKRMDAMMVLAKAGSDATAEMEALLMSYLETPTAEKKDAIEAKVDALEAKVDADSKARKDLETKQAADAAAAAEANTAAFAMNALDSAVGDDGAPRFELCARPENRKDATKLAIEHASALAIARNIDPDTLTPDLARQLMQDAYADVEQILEAQGAEEMSAWEKRFKRAPKTAPEAKGPSPQQVTQAQAPPAAAGKDEGRKEPQTRPPTLAKPPVQVTKTPAGMSLMDQILQANRDRAVY